jgi:hypothetical protein
MKLGVDLLYGFERVLLLLPGKGQNSMNECLCPVIKNSAGPREQTSLLCYIQYGKGSYLPLIFNSKMKNFLLNFMKINMK